MQPKNKINKKTKLTAGLIAIAILALGFSSAPVALAQTSTSVLTTAIEKTTMPILRLANTKPGGLYKFYIFNVDKNTGQASNAHFFATDFITVPGSAYNYIVPAGVLTDRNTYVWRARAFIAPRECPTSSDLNCGPLSDPIRFRVELPPIAPPAGIVAPVVPTTFHITDTEGRLWNFDGTRWNQSPLIAVGAKFFVTSRDAKGTVNVFSFDSATSKWVPGVTEQKVAPAVAPATGNILTRVGGAITTAFNAVVNGIRDAFNAIGAFLGNLFGITSKQGKGPVILPVTYGCNTNGLCVQTTNGPFTTSNCNNQCSPPPPPPATSCTDDLNSGALSVNFGATSSSSNAIAVPATVSYNSGTLPTTPTNSAITYTASFLGYPLEVKVNGISSLLPGSEMVLSGSTTSASQTGVADGSSGPALTPNTSYNIKVNIRKQIGPIYVNQPTYCQKSIVVTTQPTPATITIIKSVSGSTNNGTNPTATFPFMTNFPSPLLPTSFNLDVDGSTATPFTRTFTVPAPAMYVVTENLPTNYPLSGWQMNFGAGKKVQCTASGGSGGSMVIALPSIPVNSLGAGQMPSVTFNIAPGNNMVCTFYNYDYSTPPPTPGSFQTISAGTQLSACLWDPVLAPAPYNIPQPTLTQSSSIATVAGNIYSTSASASSPGSWSIKVYLKDTANNLYLFTPSPSISFTPSILPPPNGNIPFNISMSLPLPSALAVSQYAILLTSSSGSTCAQGWW